MAPTVALEALPSSTPEVAPPAPEPAAVASAAAAEAAPIDSAPAAASAQAPLAGVRAVILKSRPPKAVFFRFGKRAGTAPFVVELQPGERRSYEVWLPGHTTRKVVIDGSKPEVTLGLRPEPTP